MQSPDLRGKTALITGASRGIGAAAAEAMARCGAAVVLIARSDSALEGVAQRIRQAGGTAHDEPADVGVREHIERVIQAHGPIDIVVNNAASVSPMASVVATDPDAWRKQIEVNLYGIYLTCHYALPGMLERGWGRIVNVSSGSAEGNMANMSGYNASKAALESFSRSLANEVGEYGVRVNAFRPGVVDTEMQVTARTAPAETFGAENVAVFQGFKDQGWLRRPEEPAAVILWLCGPEADDINGQTLSIDDAEIAARAGVVAGAYE